MLLKAILERRSIRKYKSQEVSEEIIKELLEAGMLSPSAGNQRPWHFVIIKNKETLTKIPSFHQHASMVKDAPLAILVCANEQGLKYKDFFAQDCSACVQNILLEAVNKNLGAVWIGIYPREDRIAPFKKTFNLPENIIPFALISIGFPDEQKVTPDRFDPSRIHREVWAN